MHWAISFEQCYYYCVLPSSRFVIKPNNQAKALDATFQSSTRTVEVIVIEVGVLQLRCHRLAWGSVQVYGIKWFDAMWARKRSWRVAGIDGVQSRNNTEVIYGTKIRGIIISGFGWEIANAVQPLLLVKRLVMMSAGYVGIKWRSMRFRPAVA